jgi:hypothetical protein
LERNREVAVYEEGKGANAVRQAGKAGDYIVNINTKAVGLKEGLYIVLIELEDSNERVIFSDVFYLD